MKCYPILLSLLIFAVPLSVLAQLNPSKPVRIARITGNSLPEEVLPNANNTAAKYDIGGTDLGIVWRMGNGKTGYWFGDTYGADWKLSKEGGPGRAANWRSNVLGISSDEQLQDGITFDHIFNKEIIASPHITDGSGNHTTIPTAAIHANGREYVHYMEVRKWGSPGSWTTNRSGLYFSLDNGQNWSECKTVSYTANSNFAQAAYAKKDGYVYMMGTRSGRFGGVYLARVKEAEMENQPAYEYYNKEKGWLKNQEHRADMVIPAPAGELSLIWHKDFKRWIITYLDETMGQLVMRSAIRIQGPWTKAQTMVKASEYPGLYGSFIHPSSDRGKELFFLMSLWPQYNVFLMKVDLS